MIKAREPGSFLTASQKDRLEWINDDDPEFIERIDYLSEELSFLLHNNPKLNIPFFRNRKKPENASKVKNEISRTIEFLKKMSPEVSMHMSVNMKNGKKDRPFAGYFDMIQALEQPYTRTKKRNPERDRLVAQMVKIAKEFNLSNSTYEKSDLAKTIQIVCEAANAPYNYHELTKDVAKKIKGI